MRYIIDINKEHSDKINELISKKQYESVVQFVSVAVENQLYLEKTGINNSLEFPLKKIVLKEEKHDIKIFPQDNIDINISIENSHPEIVDMPKIDDVISFPNYAKIEDCWLWGQINRIFPIKLGLRILMSKLEVKKWIDLEKFKEDGALIASKYRQIIDNTDKYEDLNTRETAAGLPLYFRNNIDSLKVKNSMNRYKNQFLAYVRATDEKLDGALNQLRFTNIKKEIKGNEEKYLIGITSQGLKFAKLFNPIIDKREFNRTLSDKEKEFYINHIKENHKGEHTATIWILRKLKDGISTRDEINTEIQKDYNSRWGLKDQVVDTQRAGLMARMSELGLINKIKKGVTVKYIISDYGQTVLKNK